MRQGLQYNTPVNGQAESNTAPVYFRPRQGLATQELEEAVNTCLRGYFQNLGGISPTTDMYIKVMEHVEKPLLENVLRYVRGNQVRAAHILGINRNTLRKKIIALGIELNDLNQ